MGYMMSGITYVADDADEAAVGEIAEQLTPAEAAALSSDG